MPALSASLLVALALSTLFLTPARSPYEVQGHHKIHEVVSAHGITCPCLSLGTVEAGYRHSKRKRSHLLVKSPLGFEAEPSRHASPAKSTGRAHVASS